MAKKFITIPKGVDTNKPLDKAYQLFESVVSSFKTQLQQKKEEQENENSVLLKNQYTTFSSSHNTLK